jgi:hypothetical protein
MLPGRRLSALTQVVFDHFFSRSRKALTGSLTFGHSLKSEG